MRKHIVLTAAAAVLLSSFAPAAFAGPSPKQLEKDAEIKDPAKANAAVARDEAKDAKHNAHVAKKKDKKARHEAKVAAKDAAK